MVVGVLLFLLVLLVSLLVAIGDCSRVVLLSVGRVVVALREGLDWSGNI